MKKILFFITIILFIAGFWIPLAQMKYSFLLENDLVGVATTSDYPVFRKDTWLSGEFQEKINNWFNDNVGLRTYFVKVDNQINWSIFNEILIHVLFVDWIIICTSMHI